MSTKPVIVRSYESVPPGSHALASGGSSRAPHTVAHTAAMMRILGWSVLLATPLGVVAYPAGFLWGTHADSPYQPFSPYAFMLVAMYVAWGALMIRGARNPLANRAIVDYGILANALHGLVMLVQAFVYPHEHQHLWADVPFLFVICGVLWRWYPLTARDSQAATRDLSSRAAHSMARSAIVMRIVGWSVFLATPLGVIAYPAGFLWGTHADSPHDPLLSPYLLMLAAMYVAWAALMIRGARDPLANRAIVDYGILANALHGLVMLVQAFVYPHEHQHLWADVPFLFVICGVLWRWHPARVAR